MAVKATFLQDFDGSQAHQKLWKLSEPVKYEDEKVTKYVVTSAVYAYSGPETYIFACDHKGEIICWSQMDGSFRGEMNHERAIIDAGWECRNPGMIENIKHRIRRIAK